MHLVHTFRVQLTRIPPNWCFFTLKKSSIKCTRAAWLPPRDTGGTNPSSMERTPRMHRGGRMPGRASHAASRGKPRTASGLGRLPRCRSAPERAASQRPRRSAARREPSAGGASRRGCVPSDAASCGPATTRARAAGGGAPPPTAGRLPAPRRHPLCLETGQPLLLAPAVPVQIPEPLSTTAPVYSGGEYNKMKKRLRTIEILLRELHESVVAR